MSESVGKILAVILIIIALIEVFRAEGRVTRPIAILVLVLAAVQAILLFGLAPAPGAIGVNGWILVLATAILILSVELMRITGGIRGAPMAILLFIVSAFELFLAIGFIHL